VGTAMRKNDGETNELDSNMLAIGKYQSKAYPLNPQWAADERPQTGKPFTPSGKVFKKTSSSDTTKGQKPMTFHGIPGTVSMRAIDTKSMIS
jgi:hypothetical protein